MSSSSRWASAPTLQAPKEDKSKLQSRADRFKTQTKQNDMELLRSPSRGEIEGERSLREAAVQEEFRSHIDKKLLAHQKKYPNKLHVWINTPQREELLNILLDLRKLREGLLASHREDTFAVEVYEQCIQLAIYARHSATLTTTFPLLVRLHAQQRSAIEGRLANLSLQDSELQLNSHCYYASLYLLFLLCYSSTASSFWPTYRFLTCPVPKQDIYSERFSLLPGNNKHLRLAKTCYRAVKENDWVSVRQLLDKPNAHDELQSLLLSEVVSEMREKTWSVIQKAYMSVPAGWLDRSLMLNGWWSVGEQSLDQYLKRSGWSAIEGDTVTLRQAKS